VPVQEVKELLFARLPVDPGLLFLRPSAGAAHALLIKDNPRTLIGDDTLFTKDHFLWKMGDLPLEDCLPGVLAIRNFDTGLVKLREKKGWSYMCHDHNSLIFNKINPM
jgi:hypothetical protein